jgi:hypothetical protein
VHLRRRPVLVRCRRVRRGPRGGSVLSRCTTNEPASRGAADRRSDRTSVRPHAATSVVASFA